MHTIGQYSELSLGSGGGLWGVQAVESAGLEVDMVKWLRGWMTSQTSCYAG